MTIEQALTRSTSNDEIVDCYASQAEIDALCGEAEGSCDLVSQYGYVDVWGTDDDGGEYRLHVTPAPVECQCDDRDTQFCGVCRSRGFGRL